MIPNYFRLILKDRVTDWDINSMIDDLIHSVIPLISKQQAESEFSNHFSESRSFYLLGI